MPTRSSRQDVLEGLLAAYGGWTFLAFCRNCRVWRSLPLDDLLRRYGGDHHMMTVVNRLRCADCHRPPARLVLDNPRYERKITLVGTG